jgi:cation diffusion facilitator family transporter
MLIFVADKMIAHSLIVSTMKTEREKRATRVTLYGAAINIILVIFKLIAGVLGQSAAMIADGIHSLSDLLTDAVVIIFMKLSSRPQDEDHDYGHGKYETLATAIIGMALFVVGLGICYGGVVKIWTALQGGQLEQPGWIALVAALLSIALKEWCFQFTMRTGRAIESETVMANAWHHRSDALSSVGTAIGIGGAIALGPSWAVLDPIAAVIVSVLIVITAWKLMANALGELLEKSLPEAMEKDIEHSVTEDPRLSDIHHLRTRRIGSHIAIDMHVRLPGSLTLAEAHNIVSSAEKRLRDRFGKGTFISIHMEPVKEKSLTPKTQPHPLTPLQGRGE